MRLENWRKETSEEEKRWPQTDCWLLCDSFQLTHLTCRQLLRGSGVGRGGKNPFKGHFTLNRECSSVTSLSAWEIAVQNGNRRPAMARMVNRVSYLLPKQMVSQNERKRSTHTHILPPKCKRICQIKHEHESHSSSEKSYLCSFCYLSNVTELSQRPRV